jgi:anti-sigma B factor antagonist
MTITSKREDKTLTLVVSGRLDTSTAPELQAVVETSLAGVSLLIFDFSDLAYISSAGLRVLLTAQKILGDAGKITVKGANETVRDVFAITGFNHFMNLE